MRMVVKRSVLSNREADTHMTDHPAELLRLKAAISIGKGSMYENRNEPSMPRVTVMTNSSPEIAANIDVSTSSCREEMTRIVTRSCVICQMVC